MTRAELIERMTVAEYNTWTAFYAVEAIERERAEKRARTRRR
jgi:hypothetical protein